MANAASRMSPYTVIVFKTCMFLASRTKYRPTCGYDYKM